MAKPKLEPLNLGSIARGAAMELFELEVARIAANINDKNTPAEAKRELVLKFSFKPDIERRAIEVITVASSKLAPVASHTSRAYLGHGENSKAYIFDQDPRQELLFEPESEKLDSGVIPMRVS